MSPYGHADPQGQDGESYRGVGSVGSRQMPIMRSTVYQLLYTRAYLLHIICVCTHAYIDDDHKIRKTLVTNTACRSFLLILGLSGKHGAKILHEAAPWARASMRKREAKQIPRLLDSIYLIDYT